MGDYLKSRDEGRYNLEKKDESWSLMKKIGNSNWMKYSGFREKWATNFQVHYNQCRKAIFLIMRSCALSSSIDLIEGRSGAASDGRLAPREEIEKFLRERSLSQSFISTFVKVGYTEECRRLLNAMGFTSEDTDRLQELWDLEMKSRDEIDSSASSPSSSNEYLSLDGLYLKKLLSKPLVQALREIVMRKPFDPVEYLAHWLLNYKICEEREMRRKEFELELMIERERVVQRDDKEEVPIKVEEYEEEEEEGFVDDWSVLNDE
ncbi:uncharacterized protein LOC143427802 [Xylocopa sonorina]|uniref:uncharacterized protein LOC143427802 n=1 Tax=Xylocopa sonorina TaxID=1818115 RepID=UPI00403AD2E3